LKTDAHVVLCPFENRCSAESCNPASLLVTPLGHSLSGRNSEVFQDTNKEGI
jgi:hypothetical protein